jgi:PPK2 family polyphosphate:nucleotide phosphotransferase
MIIESSYLARPGRKVHLKDVDTADTGRFKDKEDAQGPMQDSLARLAELQEILYAENRRALLIVLQGMDTGGKDGTIEHVFRGVNPQGCSVASFKRPSVEELAHDYLWRIHKHAPSRGMITIFNRSHYESVLVERVHSLVPKSVWSRRYDHINRFERMLSDEGTVILKFFLHISRQEQKERLEARLRDPSKNWKFDPRDLAERKLWNDYEAAYEEALRECSTEHAPWYIVPADRKWFRNWVISDIIVRTLQAMKLKYPPAPEGIEQTKVK